MTQGTCMCCGNQAEATQANEGYSDCCNDRIAYGDEAAGLAGNRRWQAAYYADGAQHVELLNSWGGVDENMAVLVRTTVYRGQSAAYIMDGDGNEGLYLAKQYRVVA